MLNGSQDDDHLNWNHPTEAEKAPQPYEPEASEYMCESGACRGKKAWPFQSDINIAHQEMSACAILLRRTWWYGCRPLARSVKRWRRKILPGRMTVAACDKCPKKLSSSLCVADRLLCHSVSKARRRTNLSCGSLSSIRSVSSNIPRKVTMVLGPSVFWTATGTPRSWKVRSTTPSINEASLEWGWPKKRKSSR